MTMKRAIILICLVLLVVGCATKPVYIKPALPAYHPALPERPELVELPEDTELPQAVNINQLLLMGYAEKLEIIIDGWGDFYNELREIYTDEYAAE